MCVAAWVGRPEAARGAGGGERRADSGQHDGRPSVPPRNPWTVTRAAGVIAGNVQAGIDDMPVAYIDWGLP